MTCNNVYIHYRSDDPLFTLAIPALKEEIEDEKCLSPEIQGDLPLLDEEPMKSERNSWFGKGLRKKKNRKRKSIL